MFPAEQLMNSFYAAARGGVGRQAASQTLLSPDSSEALLPGLP